MVPTTNDTRASNSVRKFAKSVFFVGLCVSVMKGTPEKGYRVVRRNL